MKIIFILTRSFSIAQPLHESVVQQGRLTALLKSFPQRGQVSCDGGGSFLDIISLKYIKLLHFST